MNMKKYIINERNNEAFFKLNDYKAQRKTFNIFDLELKF